jgi:hypothetical protein
MPTWIRVRDTTTGAHYDVQPQSLRYGMEPLNDPRYPDLGGPNARPREPKVFVGKGGEPAVPGPVAVQAEAPGDTDAAAANEAESSGPTEPASKPKKSTTPAAQPDVSRD